MIGESSSFIVMDPARPFHAGEHACPRCVESFHLAVVSLKAAVALHFCRYNFVGLHKSVRMTPAMAAGVSDRLWMLEELVERTSR